MIEFTGERYIPSLNGQIKYEHLHRYALCLEFVTGKSVLDLASGEGYGSALLAKAAQSVIGVDIDNKSVEYAKQHYAGYQNLKFLVGSCDSVPLPDESIEVVISFETIEHHDKHEEMMQEIKRILKPGGILIISSPNRLIYSDEQNYSNPFHVKELYYDELLSLLDQYFKNVKTYGQKQAIGSFVFPLQNSYETSIKVYTGSNINLTQQFCSLKFPIYFVAICSDEFNGVQPAIDSVYIDSSDDLLKAFQNSWHQTEKMLACSQSQLQQTQSELERSQTQSHAELEKWQSQLQHKQAELEKWQPQLQHKQAELERWQPQLQHKQAELERWQPQLQHKQAELERWQYQLQHAQAELERWQAQSHAELEQSQSQLQHAQAELERWQSQSHAELKQSQSQLQHAQAELERWQSQSHAELEQSQSQLQHAQAELERWQSQSHAELEQSQSQLQHAQAELERWQSQSHAELKQSQSQLQHAQAELQRSQSTICSMQMSKFYKLQTKWYKLKRNIKCMLGK